MPTKISWTDETWNPVTGCTKVSPGCRHCYAEALTRRFHKDGPFVSWTTKAQREAGGSAVTLHPERLEQPLKWRKPRRVFVNSMSDLFHEDLSGYFIRAVFAVMAKASHHQFQVLTKRPSRMRKIVADPDFYEAVAATVNDSLEDDSIPVPPIVWPLPNVWLGVSAENQRYADERIPLLLQTPAAVRFVSAEPLLGPMDLNKWLRTIVDREMDDLWKTDPLAATLLGWGAERGTVAGFRRGIDQVIVGAESGPGARPMYEDWVRSIRDQCQDAGVAFFYKQTIRDGRKVELPELDGVVWDQQPMEQNRPKLLKK